VGVQLVPTNQRIMYADYVEKNYFLILIWKASYKNLNKKISFGSNHKSMGKLYGRTFQKALSDADSIGVAYAPFFDQKVYKEHSLLVFVESKTTTTTVYQ